MPFRSSAHRQVTSRFKQYSYKRFAADIRTAETRAFACEVLLRMIVENSDLIDTREVRRSPSAKPQREAFLLFSFPEQMLDGIATLFASDAELEDDDPREIDDHCEEDDHSGPENPDDEPDMVSGDPDGTPVSGNSLIGHSGWVEREFSITPILTPKEAT